MATTAPTSPAFTRRSAPPVTPQRLVRHTEHLSHLPSCVSPLTPASTASTPYTPLSLRSLSSFPYSNFTTPASAASSEKKYAHSLSAGISPDTALAHRARDKSFADIADNWRSRANENGIRVASAHGGDDSQYAADDEASERTLSDTASPALVPVEEALLPPPFLSTHRRPRAHSTAIVPPRTTPTCSPLRIRQHTPLSPPTLRTPARRTLTETLNLTLNTPPQLPARTKALTMKGSFTDPAQTRRRPAFGQPTHDLFDIDENEYAPYPQSFASPTPATPLQDPFNGSPFPTLPFPALSTISEDDFHALHSNSHSYLQSLSFPPSPHPPASPPQSPSTCSVCAHEPSSLAVLSPCGHPLCSACLTGALNIIGEKDMACAVCGAGVIDFQLQSVERSQKSSVGEERNPFLLPSAFENARLNAKSVRNEVKGKEEDIVLRIDNVPWDITPPAIRTFLRQPTARVHVLLDRRGKTLSHAFAEVRGEEAARAALRGAQNAVLGRGRRARGVTVTRAGQAELMRALFPSWRGSFDGARPSLNGLDNAGVITTLEAGLMAESELDALLHLVRSPDSHFLKVPELPFHALISILDKFPADIDSRVFWSSSLRDKLFDIAFAAIQVLLSRIHSGSNSPGSNDPELLAELVRAGTSCQAFTSQQLRKLADLPPPAPQPESPVGALAREFGVEAGLVERLAQRLAGIC